MKAFHHIQPCSRNILLKIVVERIVYNRIYGFVNKCSVIYKGQYGFRQGHSTEHALTHVVNNLYKALDSKQTSVGIFLDLSKAFDTLDHQILFHKLYFYGIGGMLWIGSAVSVY